MFETETVLLIFLIQFSGYFVKGLVGFGNPLITAPLLSQVLDPSLVAPGTLLLDIPVNAGITWKNRGRIRWRTILPLLLAVLAGVVPGVLLLKIPNQRLLKILLGLLVLGLGADMALRREQKAGRELPGLRLLTAFASGICAGLFGINMLIVAYLKRSAESYDAFKGSLCFLFLAENVFRFFTYLAAGLITAPVLRVGAISLPAAALGVGLGMALSARLPEKKLMTCAVVTFLCSGVSILIRALFFS